MITVSFREKNAAQAQTQVEIVLKMADKSENIPEKRKLIKLNQVSFFSFNTLADYFHENVN